MKIGELAARCGLPAQTIRFYEKRGLLRQPVREANGYRVYDQDALDRILFVRRAQAAGLTLAAIGSILDVRAEGQAPCEHAAGLLRSKLDEVAQRLEELRILQTELLALVERSEQLDPADCDPAEVCNIFQATTERATGMAP